MFTSTTATSGSSFHVRRRRDSGGDKSDDNFAWFRDRNNSSGRAGFDLDDEDEGACRSGPRKRRKTSTTSWTSPS